MGSYTTSAQTEEFVGRLVLVACVLASSLVGIDSLMTTVALPSIASDLGAGLAAQQWIVAAFLLALGSLLLVGGALGDVYGRWTILGVGAAGLGVASAVCAAAPSAPVLISGRFVMGTAAALMLPSVLAVITSTFEGEARTKAIASWSAWSALSVVGGPLLGGFLISTLSWRAIYLVQVPCAIVALVLIRRVARASDRVGPVGAGDATRTGSIDVVGGLLAVPTVGGPAFFIIQGPQFGWLHGLNVGALTLGVLAGVALGWWERRVSNPLLPLGLFRVWNFTVINVVTFVLYAGLISSGTYTVLFLQSNLGYPPSAAGVIGAFPVVVLFVLSGRLARLADHFGARICVAAGAAIAGLGMLWLLRLDGEGDFVRVLLPSVSVHGLGLAMVVAPLTSSVMSSVDEEHAGAASGINSAVARVGSMVAIAVVGLVISTQFSQDIDKSLSEATLPRNVIESVKDTPLSSTPPPEASGPGRAWLKDVLASSSIDAYRSGMLLAGCLPLIAGAVALFGIRERPPRRFDAAGTLGCPITGARTHIDAQPDRPPPNSSGR